MCRLPLAYFVINSYHLSSLNKSSHWPNSQLWWSHFRVYVPSGYVFTAAFLLILSHVTVLPTVRQFESQNCFLLCNPLLLGWTLLVPLCTKLLSIFIDWLETCKTDLNCRVFLIFHTWLSVFFFSLSFSGRRFLWNFYF